MAVHRIMPAMLASVIVRTMGRPSLRDALASVVDQRRDDVEVIVVDARGDLPKPAGTPLPVRWLSLGRRLHRSVAAQTGLEAVNTRWAIFLDDDDLMLAGHLDKLLTALAEHPQAVLAHTGVELVGQGAFAGRTGVFDQAFQPWELLLGNRLPIHAAMFDAQRARQAGQRFDVALDVYEDWDFWLQLSLLGAFVHVPGVSARYFVGDDSSDAHRNGYGDAAYWRVWHKWWHLAPQSWWAQAFRAGSTVGDLERHLQTTRASLEARLKDLRVAGEQATQLHTLLAQKVGELLQMQRQLGETQHALAQSQGSLQWTQEALQTTRTALDATDQQLALRTQALDATSRQLALTTQALTAAQIGQQRQADQVQAMLHSSSWRVTRPLRQVGTLARTAHARAARFKREVWSAQTLLRGSTFRDYERWILDPEAADRNAREAAYRQAPASVTSLAFAVVMPVFNPRLEHLDAAIASVSAQWHGRWQLCVADDASTTPGVRERLAAWASQEPRIQVLERPANGHIAACTNTALAMVQADWVVFLDQDDVLAPHALAELAQTIASNPDLALLYSDEDKLDARGRRHEPHFKPGFSIELLRGQNFINHLSAYRRTLINELGGLREGLEGAQDHDLALRAAERLRPSQIGHVPRVIYHWRAGPGSTASAAAHKAYASDAALRAVAEHLARTEPGAQVEAVAGFAWLRVRYPVPAQHGVVAMAAVANDASWLTRLQALTDVAHLHAAGHATAPWLLLLREGLWPASSSWLDEMVALLARPGVGVVGGAIHRRGLLLHGALVPAANGQTRTLCAGVATGQAGPFGAARLVRGCDAVTPHAMLLRRELWPLWQQAQGDTCDERALDFGQRLRSAGWRVVWTPFAAFEQA